MYEKIKRLADAKGESIRQVSIAADVPYSCISDLKSGRSKSLSAENLGKLAKHFGVNIDYFVG